MKKYDIAIVTAHPDDAFITAGGTILYAVAKNYSVFVISITDGANGSSAQGESRKKEFAEALSASGAEGYVLQFTDGRLPYEEDKIHDAILPILLELDPKVIIGHGDVDPHPDHRAVCDVLEKVTSTIWHNGHHRLKSYLCMPPAALTIKALPSLSFEFFCDITGLKKKKDKLISLHESQFPQLGIRMKQQNLFSSLLGSFIGRQSVEFFYSSKNSLFSNGNEFFSIQGLL